MDGALAPVPGVSTVKVLEIRECCVVRVARSESRSARPEQRKLQAPSRSHSVARSIPVLAGALLSQVERFLLELDEFSARVRVTGVRGEGARWASADQGPVKEQASDAFHFQGLAVAWRDLGEDGRGLAAAQSAGVRQKEKVSRWPGTAEFLVSTCSPRQGLSPSHCLGWKSSKLRQALG